MMNKKPWEDESWLKTEIEEKGRTINSISEEHGIAFRTVAKRANRNGFKRPIESEEKVREAYEKHETVEDMANEFGVKKYRFILALNEHGIKDMGARWDL